MTAYKEKALIRIRVYGEGEMLWIVYGPRLDRIRVQCLVPVDSRNLSIS
jgi:hypothetical protein